MSAYAFLRDVRSGARPVFVRPLPHPTANAILIKRNRRNDRYWYAYGTKGNPKQITNPSGSTVLMANYDDYAYGFNQPGKIKNANGVYTPFKYNDKGNVTDTIVLKHGVGAALHPVSYVPSAADIVAWTKTSYDSYGNLTETKPMKEFAARSGLTFINTTTIRRI